MLQSQGRASPIWSRRVRSSPNLGNIYRRKLTPSAYMGIRPRRLKLRNQRVRPYVIVVFGWENSPSNDTKTFISFYKIRFLYASKTLSIKLLGSQKYECVVLSFAKSSPKNSGHNGNNTWHEPKDTKSYNLNNYKRYYPTINLCSGHRFWSDSP
jgi:hypothetical protein